MNQIVFLDRGTVTVPLRKPQIPHEWVEYERTDPQDIVQRLQKATIAVTNKVVLKESDLSQLPSLKLIAITATGVNNVDIAACKKRNIGVANVPGYTKESLPEHVFMLMLALRRNLPAYLEAMESGRWQKSSQPTLNDFPIEDLLGSILGLMGYGDSAKGVERLARAFGMKVLIAERKGVAALRPGRVLFQEVLRNSDVVSLHTPLTPMTRNMIDAPELGIMKKGALLINTARGGLINEMALATALKEGRLGGAGLDVLAEEPPKNGNPLLDLHLPNLIVTPHIAWISRQAQEILVEEVIQNIEAFAAGNARNLIS